MMYPGYNPLPSRGLKRVRDEAKMLGGLDTTRSPHGG